MKALIFLIFVTVVTQNNYTQTLPLIKLLEGEYYQQVEALTQITEQNLQEYLPYIEENVFLQETMFMQWRFLEAMQKLNSENIIEYVNTFIQNLDELNSPINEDPAFFKAFAAILLFKETIDDYSHAHLVLDYLENPNESIAPRILLTLDDIFTHVTSLQNRVINILIDFFHNGSDYEKKFSLTLLRKFNYISIESLCKISGITSDNEWIRNYSYGILQENNDPELDQMYKDNLSTESSARVRLIFVGNLIKSYGEPADIKFVMDYLPNEPINGRKDMMEIFLKEFVPIYPTISTLEMIDSLDSYTDQIFQFGWIKGQSNYWSYKRKTENLKKHFQNNNTQDVCTNLSWIISEAESQHGSDSLTEEGYKFLFYYPGYIKEKIEKEFGVCE